MRVAHVCSNDQGHGLSNRIPVVENAYVRENGDSDQGAEFFCNKALAISLDLPFEDVGVN